MNQHNLKITSITLLVILAISPLLAALRMPEPFKYLDMIAGPAIGAEAFINVIFNAPALLSAFLCFAFGQSLLDKGKVTAGITVLIITIAICLAGLSFMYYRSTLYGLNA